MPAIDLTGYRTNSKTRPSGFVIVSLFPLPGQRRDSYSKASTAPTLKHICTFTPEVGAEALGNLGFEPPVAIRVAATNALPKVMPEALQPKQLGTVPVKNTNPGIFHY
jgi:hypothetical protein